MSATVGEALEAAIDALTAAGVQTPRLDAEVMLEHCTGLDRARFTAEPGLPMPAGSAPEFASFVRRRIQREPVAYVTGHKGFRRILLECDSRALIPRPETELLVEVALEIVARLRSDGSDGVVKVAEIGTGSGAVALALADELPGCDLVATDTSADALALARHNAHRLGLGDRVEFREDSVPEGEFDVVLANLPYVPDSDWGGLAPEITQFEPSTALVGGPDGLDVIRDVAARLGPPGSGAGCEASVAALEIGRGQAEAVRELLAAGGFESSETRPDLAGIDRVVLARAPNVAE